MGALKSKLWPPALKDIEELDPEELRRKIDEGIDKSKNVPVNIAVTGNAGVGKSSFINSLRGLRAYSEGAAAVGVHETIFGPTKYMHPINKNIVLWDLPSVGTPTFPKDTYLQNVRFEKYDYFLIISASRFLENDFWLANEVQRLGEKIFFIRTKNGNGCGK
jgi:predicted GTPase